MSIPNFRYIEEFTRDPETGKAWKFPRYENDNTKECSELNKPGTTTYICAGCINDEDVHYIEERFFEYKPDRRWKMTWGETHNNRKVVGGCVGKLIIKRYIQVFGCTSTLGRCSEADVKEKFESSKDKIDYTELKKAGKKG